MSVLPSSSSATTGQTASAAVRFTALGHLTVLEASGADSLAFLQGQLTQDMKPLADQQAALAGYCTAKGRMLASAIVWKSAGEQGDAVYRLMVDSSLAATFSRRLSMFVLRSKVKIADSALKVTGVAAGPDALAALEQSTGSLPRAPWQRADLPSGTWIAAPQAGDGLRWWWVATEEQAAAFHAQLGSVATTEEVSDWRAADIDAGLPWITASTQDMFVPQMVNLELVGGVSFTKGCYPGQEVVARSHYLGKLKRRMFFGTAVDGEIDEHALAGTDVYHSADQQQPSGRVVNAARRGTMLHLLFESTFTSMEDGALHLGSATGPVITPKPLPYPVTAKSE